MPTKKLEIARQKHRILIYGLNFWPEPVGIGKYTGELAFWLKEQGYDIRVVTTAPYFPTWKSSGMAYLCQNTNGIKIMRCPLWVPSRPSGITRLIHLASFTFSSIPVVLMQLSWRPTILYTVAPSFMCTPISIALKRLCPSIKKTILHIQDLELDAAFNLGLLRGQRIKGWAECAESMTLRSFDVVSTISERMRERIIAKGVARQRTAVVPNWIDTDLIRPHVEGTRNLNSYRKELSIDSKSIIAMYSGSMNKKQGMEILVGVIKTLKDVKNLIWLLAGEGPTKGLLETELYGYRNVKILSLQPENRMNEWLNLADIHLLPQKSAAADLVLPSKLMGMMASGKPIVAGAEAGTELGEIAEICGLRVTPENIDEFANAVMILYKSKNLRYYLGAQGRKEVEKRFDINTVLPVFEKLMIASL